MAKLRRQYIPEGILIIVSILIAFAIDAWWEERQQRSEEVRILKALREEFQDNVDRLPRHIEISETNAESARKLIADIQNADPDSSVTVTPEQLWALTVHGSFDATRGAFDAMQQSGDLRFIENPMLRQQLMRWPLLVADAVENDHFLRTIASPRTFEYLVKRVDLGRVDEIVQCRANPPGNGCSSGSFELEATQELSGLTSQIRGWSKESAVEFEVVRQEALNLVRILDEELAEKD